MRSWLVAAVLVAPSIARADRVAVKVIEVAGDVAYVTPGKGAGLAPGNDVTLPSGTRKILEVAEDTASIKLDGLVVAVGQTGSVDVTSGKTAATTGDKPLRAEQVAAGQWPDPVMPAQHQTPKAVPLGNTRRTTSAHVTVVGTGYAALGRDASYGDGEARVIASWDLTTERPFAVDADVAGRVFSEGYDKQLRVPLFVRFAQLRYGSAVDPAFAIGRLRYAASSVGMLDGARGAVHIDNLELAAFGGIVPDPTSGKPDPSATRFGAEAIYDLQANPWRPRVAVTATGSTWSGTLDERRLAVDASANHGALWLDAWAEGQQFSANNPWGARTVDLTGAGATAELRSHGDHVGIDVDFLRPERSLRLAAALPPSWLCTQYPQPGDTAEACRNGDYWTTATVSAGTRRGRFSVDAYGTMGRTHLVETSLDTSAYIRGEVQLGAERLSLGATVGKASFATWDSAELGLGTARWAPLDLVVRYRAELLDYLASTGPILLNTIAMDVRYPYSRSLDVGISAVGTTGDDRSLIALLTTIVWRPLP